MQCHSRSGCSKINTACSLAAQGCETLGHDPGMYKKNANSVDTFKTHCLKFLVKDVYNCMHFPIDTLE